MQTQEHNKSQDAPDGLYLHVFNSRIRDILVGLIGTHMTQVPPHMIRAAGGVIQSTMAPTLGMCMLLMVLIITAPVKRVFDVSVLSDVFLIDLLNTHYQ